MHKLTCIQRLSVSNRLKGLSSRAAGLRIINRLGLVYLR
jgi:hypothetical protein